MAGEEASDPCELGVNAQAPAPREGVGASSETSAAEAAAAQNAAAAAAAVIAAAEEAAAEEPNASGEQQDTQEKQSTEKCWHFLFEFGGLVDQGGSPDDDDEGRDSEGSGECANDDDGGTASDPGDSSGSTSEPGESGGAEGKCESSGVPKHNNLARAFPIDVANITTVTIRNVPTVYTTEMFIEELDCVGLAGLYDFVYLPMDRGIQRNVGYAFVNFTDTAVARHCMQVMAGYTFRCFEHSSGKVAQVDPSHIQGLEKNMEYYSSSAVQRHGDQRHRPRVFAVSPGTRIPWSSPSQEVPEPRYKQRQRERQRTRRRKVFDPAVSCVASP